MVRSLFATLFTTAILLPTLFNEAWAGGCQSRQASFNQLAGKDAAIVAKMRAAAAANNCTGLIAAGNQRIALLQRAASMRSSVVNCEDETHKNSDRDPAGFDSREIALTRNAMAACSATAGAVANNSQPAKPSRAAAQPAAASRDSDCSDVSGTGGPRIACRERRPAPVMDSSKPTVKQAQAGSRPISPSSHSAETGAATKIAAELFPEAVPAAAIPGGKDAERGSEQRPGSKLSEVAAVSQRDARPDGSRNTSKPNEGARGNGPCGAIITKEYVNIGNNLQQEFAECLIVANKCTAKINFRASSSSVRNTKLSEDVGPGKVGKICATRERETITYLGWKFESERWPK